MSTASDFPANDQQWCLLCDTDSNVVITVASIKTPQRICANNMSWMKKANQRWLTIPEFLALFGDFASAALSRYSPTYTVEHLIELNNRLKSSQVSS